MLIRECFQMFCLAAADYRRERLLSLCSILGLAAVLAPLLVLYGVKFGVVTTMVSRMRSDPLTLELSPVSSGHFTGDFFTSLRQEPGVAFVLPPYAFHRRHHAALEHGRRRHAPHRRLLHGADGRRRSPPRPLRVRGSGHGPPGRKAGLP